MKIKVNNIYSHVGAEIYSIKGAKHGQFLLMEEKSLVKLHAINIISQSVVLKCQDTGVYFEITAEEFSENFKEVVTCSTWEKNTKL